MAEHLLNYDRCALWAGMGTGKTTVAENFLDALYLGGESHPTLVLGPLRVARNVWSNETLKWEHLRSLSVIPIVGSEKQRLEALRHDAPVFTTNYDNLIWLIEHYGDRWPFRNIVADEARRLASHRISERVSTIGKMFLAGQGAKRAGALARISWTHVKRFIELTGTPAPNGLGDLWGQLWYLDKGRRLGRTHTDFLKRWFCKGYDGYSVGPKSEYVSSEIHESVKDICLTIDIRDYIDLDEPIINDIFVDLSPQARKLYREMEKEMFIQIEDRNVEAFGAAAKTQKCLQIANGAVYVDPLADSDQHPRAKEWRLIHDEKIEAMESLVSELSGAPLIVSYEFKSDLARLVKAFPKGRVLKTHRDEEDFKMGKLPLLFMHPQSGGYGLDGFQKVCNNICFFGHNWSLENYQQIIERIGPTRQYQENPENPLPVFIHRIIARQTVDELVIERQETKRETQDILLDACKRWKKS